LNYRSIIGCKLASKKKTWEKSLPDIKVGTPAAFPGAKTDETSAQVQANFRASN
jgi:hypothetical protein